MILVGNQRAGGNDLARHLLKEENDHVLIHEVRGFACDNLHGAFKEAEMMAKGTRCKQYLFSLSLNPPQDEYVSIDVFEAAIGRVEEVLGLTGQPRAIVFHEKEGRRHAHAVWSRIATEQMKAIALPYSRRKLNALSKEIYLDNGWKLPPGHIDKSLADTKNFTFAEWQQAKRINQDPRMIKQVLRDAYDGSKDMQQLSRKLKDRGYLLAQGNRRSFVVVDQYGEVYSLPRQLGLKTKEVRAKLGDPSNLQTVEKAREIASDQTLQILTGFKRQNDRERNELARITKEKVKVLVKQQRAERRVLENKQEQRRIAEAKNRQARFRKGWRGLWDRLTGEHAKIAKQNETEARQNGVRDRLEFRFLLISQIKSRRELKQKIRSADLHSANGAWMTEIRVEKTESRLEHASNRLVLF